jgi:hypothetical protein
MIELAAKAWGLSVTGTIIKLTQRGFDLPIDDTSIHAYLAAHVEYRKRLGKLWKDSQSYPCHNQSMLRPMLSMLRLPDEFYLERWNAGPAKILGENLCHTIEETLLPESMVCVGNEQTPRCRSARRIFRGGKWKEALVIPFFSAPERICAFGFIGRQADMTKYVFRCANVDVNARNRPNREAGLALHPAVHEMAADWDRTVFAVSDPMAYLQIQLRQFEYANNPLPLVLWQDSPATTTARTQHAWWMLHDRRVIFWDQSVSLATLRQAIAIDGWISAIGPRHSEVEAFRDYLWRFTPMPLFRQVQKHAKPWPKAFANAMLKWTDAHIEDLFVQLQLDALQIERVRKACSRELRRRLDVILNSQRIRHFVHFNNHVVVEKPDGWYCHRDGDVGHNLEPVCDARLKVSQIVTYNRKERIRMIYSGAILFHGEEIPFTAPEHEIDRHPLAWMRDFLRQQNKGTLRFDTKWDKYIIHIATAFHDPKIVKGIDTVGWDPDKLAFLLPGRIIGLDGTCKLPLTEDVSAFPAARLRYSSASLPANLHELGNEYEMGLFWGALAGVLSNVVAPALLQPTKGIGLIGKGAQTVGMAVAEAAGCLTREIRALTSVRKSSEEEQRHRWPLRVPIAPNATSSAMTKWLEMDQSYARNCITPLDEETAERKWVDGGWHLVRGLEPATVNPNLLRFVPCLVPAYLRDVCERRLRVEDVVDDLAGFIGRQGGTMDLEQARKVLRMAAT